MADTKAKASGPSRQENEEQISWRRTREESPHRRPQGRGRGQRMLLAEKQLGKGQQEEHLSHTLPAKKYKSSYHGLVSEQRGTRIRGSLELEECPVPHARGGMRDHFERQILLVCHHTSEAIEVGCQGSHQIEPKKHDSVPPQLRGLSLFHDLLPLLTVRGGEWNLFNITSTSTNGDL